MVTKQPSMTFFGEIDKRTEVLDYFAGLEKLAKVRDKLKNKEKIKIKKEKKEYFE